MNKSKTRGFTLIELMVTLMMGMIIVAAAIPSFLSMVQRNRVAAAASDLVADISQARGEAIRRGKAVIICPKDGSLTNGWEVRVDNVCTNASATVLSAHDPIDGIEFKENVAAALLISPTGVAHLNDDWRAFTFQASNCSAGLEGAGRSVTLSLLMEVKSVSQACIPGF